jgi:hypothetical protein
MCDLKGVKTPTSVFLPLINQGEENITVSSFEGT